MSMYKYLLVYIVLAISCNGSNKKEEYIVNIDDRVKTLSFTQESEIFSSNVGFSEKGAEFNIGTELSYLRIDSLDLENQKGLNFSMWFQFTGEDATLKQTVFSIVDTVNLSKRFHFWIVGKRFIGQINRNHLWAKDYDYRNGMSRDFYDLFPLELGKFYFLSVNISNDTVEVYINSELYTRSEGLKETSLDIDKVYLGIIKEIDGEFTHQFQGYLRNFTIFNKILNKKEIEALSQETYDAIFPFNDAFELSKFKSLP